MAALEAGIQLHLPTYSKLSVRDLVSLGQTAYAGGVSQIWVTDNLQSRNAWVVLAALAGNVPLKLGTAVMVQYFRSPLDVADAAAAISELLDGRELGIGIARGNANTPRLVHSPKPITFLRETAQSLHHLLAGDTVSFDRYPTLASYFNLVPEARFQLAFTPQSPVRLYCGGNAPLSLAVGGQHMDGLIFGGTFQAVARTGRMPELLRTFDAAAAAGGKTGTPPRVAEIKISLSNDRQRARDFVKHSAGPRVLSLRKRGYTVDEIRGLGVPPEDIDRMEQAEAAGASRHDLEHLCTDAMIDAIFIAGDAAYCRERVLQTAELARGLGFHQLMFSELGPDVDEAMRVLCDDILPLL